jgi:hypothetical protein
MADNRKDGSDGGPAFAHGNPEQGGDAGMSLRDYFAGEALPQAVADYGEPHNTLSSGQRRDRGNPVLPYAASGSGTREEIIAAQAYKYADAMLVVRNT